MSDETKLHPWVNSEVDEAGDLHLTSGVQGLSNMVVHHVLTMEQEAINDWLESQGWASPEERAELIEVLTLCVIAMKTGIVDLNHSHEYVLERADRLVENHKGEQ